MSTTLPLCLARLSDTLDNITRWLELCRQIITTAFSWVWRILDLTKQLTHPLHASLLTAWTNHVLRWWLTIHEPRLSGPWYGTCILCLNYPDMLNTLICMRRGCVQSDDLGGVTTVSLDKTKIIEGLQFVRGSRPYQFDFMLLRQNCPANEVSMSVWK